MRALPLLVLAGCGRIAFDPAGGSGDREDAMLDDGMPTDGLTGTINYQHGGGVESMFSSTNFMFNNASDQFDGSYSLIVISWTGSDTLASVTDTLGTSYAQLGNVRGVGTRQQVVYAGLTRAAPSGTNRYTVTFSGPTSGVHVRLVMYAGVDLANPVDATDDGASTTQCISGPVTIATPNAVMFAACAADANVDQAGPGFTMRYRGFVFSFLGQDRLVTAPGAYTATAPLSSPGNAATNVVVLRPR